MFTIVMCLALLICTLTILISVLRVLMVEGMFVVVNVIANGCDQPTPGLVRPIGAHGGKVMYFRSFCIMGELGFLNCDDICMSVVNKQFEVLEFVFNSVYVVDL